MLSCPEGLLKRIVGGMHSSHDFQQHGLQLQSRHGGDESSRPEAQPQPEVEGSTGGTAERQGSGRGRLLYSVAERAQEAGGGLGELPKP